jgi:hypothetical protein
MKTTRTPTLTETQMIAILGDFNRKPVKARKEYSDLQGNVLIPFWRMAVYYSRPINRATTLGYIEFFSRCGCLGPCTCETNGYHITAAGKAYLATRSVVTEASAPAAKAAR